MSQEWTSELWEAVQEKVFSRASVDSEYRDLCLQDANAAVLEVSGHELPPKKKIQFAEPSDTDIVFLPPLLDEAGELWSVELADTALDHQADRRPNITPGGMCATPRTYCCPQ